MRLWAEDRSTVTGLKGLFVPKCKHCKIPGDFYAAKIGRFAINDGTGRPNSHHIDIEMRCPKCGYWWPHGVAVSRDHYNWVTKEFRKGMEC